MLKLFIVPIIFMIVLALFAYFWRSGSQNRVISSEVVTTLIFFYVLSAVPGVVLAVLGLLVRHSTAGFVGLFGLMTGVVFIVITIAWLYRRGRLLTRDNAGRPIIHN